MGAERATMAGGYPGGMGIAALETSAQEELPVTVALMMRPLVGPELVDGCQACVFAHATEQAVTLVSEHKFTFDHVYHAEEDPAALPATVAAAAPATAEKRLYDHCVAPLVTGLLAGYNATVLAYGQTGSGKTHTMGTAHQPGGATEGVIPRVIAALFAGIAGLPDGDSISLRVAFIEIHREEIRDLLVGGESHVTIRDAPGHAGGVVLVGVKELEVRTVAQMAAALADGSLARATAATGMNHRSSRSHAIFTIHVERRGADSADVTRAKMHLVDLAGSERAKRTKAEGQRLKEGIQINKGLLALGNVISALGDDKRRHAGGHVPYRDSKLTRLLQDSLGGNSRTVMVACISPADANLDETLSTLKYANRARNITNKPTLNLSANASEEVAKLRRALAASRAEVEHLRASGGTASPTERGGAGFTFAGIGPRSDASLGGAESSARLDAMEARAMVAEAEAARLRADLSASEEAVAAVAAAELAAYVERDRLALKLEDAGLSPVGDEGGTSVIRGYLATVQALRLEQHRLKHQLAAALGGRLDPYAEDPAASYDLDDGDVDAAYDDGDPEDIDGDDDEVEEHALDFDDDMADDELQAELASVERSLQAKEARMRAMSSAAQKLQAEVDISTTSPASRGDTGATGAGQNDVEELREKYGRILQSLESEKSELAAERDGLLAALAAASRQGDDVRRQVEKKNRGRLVELEKRLKEVQRQASKTQESARLRAKSDQAATALQADIQRLRAARVELVRRMERAAKDGIATQREAERALQAARKDGRRHAAAAQKAQNAVDRQAAVLRRKTEEAANAREQLRALQVAARANRKTKPAAAANTVASGVPAVASVPATGPTPAPGPATAGPGNPGPIEADKAGPGTGLGLGGRKAWIEAELAAAVERAELRASLDDSLAQRAALGRRFPHLASPGPVSSSSNAFARTPGPPAVVWGTEATTPIAGGTHSHFHLHSGAGDDEAVEEEICAVTEQIAALQERVVRSEEREEVRGGIRRWSRVRSLGEARSLLTMLFNSAAAASRRVSAVEGMTAGRRTHAISLDAGRGGGAAAPAAAPTTASTPRGSVLAEADAVLMHLQSLKMSTASRTCKKSLRPPWQAVGPTSLAPKPITDEAAQDDKPAEPAEARSRFKVKEAFSREADDLEEEDVETSESEAEDDDASLSGSGSDGADPDNDPEWNEDCQTPAMIGRRMRRAAAVPKPAAAPKEAVIKKGPACTVCTQMFDRRVEGHVKSHKRCPFFSLYVMEKDTKALEEQGAGAEPELEAKRAEHRSELCCLRRAVQDGSIRAPGDPAVWNVGDSAIYVADGPNSHPVSAPNSASSSDSAAFSEGDTWTAGTSTSGGSGRTALATPHAAIGTAKVEVPLSELIATCRTARRRAENLLHASGGRLTGGMGAKGLGGSRPLRSPFGDMSNERGACPGSAAATTEVRKRMSFGASGAGAAGGFQRAFQAPGVTSHRGSFEGVPTSSADDGYCGDLGVVEDETFGEDL